MKYQCLSKITDSILNLGNGSLEMGILDKIVGGLMGSGSGGLGDLLNGNMANLLGGSGDLMSKFQQLYQDKKSNDDIQVDLNTLSENPETDTGDIQEIMKKVGGNQISLSNLKQLVMDDNSSIGNSLRNIFSKLG